MLSEAEATIKLQAVFPDRSIEPPIKYNGLFIFQAFSPDPIEGEFDPFFSVNMETGEVRDFSIITDGDPHEIERLFLEKQGGAT